MLTFDQLETLRTIVNHGTFSRAADELFLTQPAVSQRVKHLEQALGVEVFARNGNGRGFTLTLEGERVLRFANEVLGSLHSLESELRLESEVRDHTISIACGPFIARYILPRVVAVARSRMPSLRVRNIQAGMHDLNEVVRRGDTEFAVHSHAYVDPALATVPFFQDQVVMVASPTHPVFREAAEPGPEDLARHQFLLSHTNTEPRQIAERWAARWGVKFDVVVETSSYDALKEGALAGLGLAVVPETMIRGEVERGELQVIKLDGLPCQRLICLVYNPELPMSSVATAFLEIVRDGTWTPPLLNPC